MNYTRDPSEAFFYIADLNGDGTLDYEEFERITRHVESEFYF
jgi:hypothetical protein